ncbi:hypothetical protein RHS03_02608, partial [Rhizoctonia solani]
MFSLTDIWSSVLIILFSFYHKIHPPPRTGILPKPIVGRPRRRISLPPEILDEIFSLNITLLLSEFQYETVRDYRIQQKHFMREVCRIARCSKLFHQVVRGSLHKIWGSCGYNPRSERASSGARVPGLGVWIITTEAGSLPIDFNLATYTALEIASVNYHTGVEWSQSQQCFRRFRCISSYPRSLRQLEILRLHTPEEEVIRLVSDCCPGLTELRLVRCTMFNDPDCWYWRTHTRNQDHDYMKSSEVSTVIDYANHMAHLLRGLPLLEALHIGHYLNSIHAVLTHRFEDAHKRYHPIRDRASHVDGVGIFNNLQARAMALARDNGPPIDSTTVRLAERKLWSVPCPECEREFARPIEIAERLSSGILAAHIKPLKHVSFANFLSDKRITPSSWRVGRQWCGTDLQVWTEDPDRPSSRITQEMVRLNDRWEPPQLGD